MCKALSFHMFLFILVLNIQKSWLVLWVKPQESNGDLQNFPLEVDGVRL